MSKCNILYKYRSWFSYPHFTEDTKLKITVVVVRTSVTHAFLNQKSPFLMTAYTLLGKTFSEKKREKKIKTTTGRTICKSERKQEMTISSVYTWHMTFQEKKE